MSIKDYTNEELLKSCLVVFMHFCVTSTLDEKVNFSLLEDFKRLQKEVLERMEK